MAVCSMFGGSAAILLVVGLTFFSQNLALFQCATFFPRSQAGIEIGETLVGATLAWVRRTCPIPASGRRACDV